MLIFAIDHADAAKIAWRERWLVVNAAGVAPRGELCTEQADLRIHRKMSRRFGIGSDKEVVVDLAFETAMIRVAVDAVVVMGAWMNA